MAKDLIQVTRGNKAQKPKLHEGELGLCKDTEEVFIGNTLKDIRIATEKDVVDVVHVEPFSSEPVVVNLDSGTGSTVTDSTTNGNIKVNNVEVEVYKHPTTHEASMMTQDTTHRFVTDTDIATFHPHTNKTVLDKITMYRNIYISDISPSPTDGEDGDLWFVVGLETPTEPPTDPPTEPTIPVTDYAFRFDANELALNDNDKVSVWNDLSVNGMNLAQANAANQPVYLASGINGKPAVSFANPYYMDKTSFTLANYMANTCFVILQTNSANTSQSILGIGEQSATTSIASAYLVRISSSGVYQIRFANSNYTGVTAPVDTNPTILTAHYDGSVSNLYKNGTLTSTPLSYASGINSSANTLRIGYDLYTTSTEYLNAKVGEIIYFARALNSTELSSMHSYLKTKWGIA